MLMPNCTCCVWKDTIIGVNREDHVACKVGGACIGMCSDIIKKLMTCICHNFRASSLTGGDSADGWKNGGVNRTSIVEECANDVLHPFDVFFGEWGCSVCRYCLHPCPKLDW